MYHPYHKRDTIMHTTKPAMHPPPTQEVLRGGIGRQISGYLEKGIQTPTAQGQSTKTISMIKWWYLVQGRKRRMEFAPPFVEAPQVVECHGPQPVRRVLLS